MESDMGVLLQKRNTKRHICRVPFGPHKHPLGLVFEIIEVKKAWPVVKIYHGQFYDSVPQRRKPPEYGVKEAGQRPVFNEIVDEIKSGKFNGILTWAADRISRNAGDLGRIVDLMDSGKLIEIRTYGQKFTNSPNEKFLLMILGSQAKLENDNKVVNVKRGLRARCEMGLWPCTAPTGYLNSTSKEKSCVVEIDPHRAPIVKKMFERVAYGNMSGRRLHAWLKDEIKFTTKNGKPLTISNIYITLRNHFYYGSFEYPKGGGKWYIGKHTPIITKDLFDKVQEKMLTYSASNEPKEFAFTRLMTCTLCGKSAMSTCGTMQNMSCGTGAYSRNGSCSHACGARSRWQRKKSRSRKKKIRYFQRIFFCLTQPRESSLEPSR